MSHHDSSDPEEIAALIGTALGEIASNTTELIAACPGSGGRAHFRRVIQDLATLTEHLREALENWEAQLS